MTPRDVDLKAAQRLQVTSGSYRFYTQHAVYILIPVLVAGDPVGDVGDGLSVALFVSEAAREHDELSL